ncbi:P-loop NTPase [Candidatus Dependentiae bacterium]|nr:P-loop NTPase [Candidatus Dependentiae bacterium]
MDPRISIIDKRLAEVKRIIAVSGGKGGVGKSSAAAALSLCLSDSGYKTGLIDLDLNGYSSHVILNISDKLFPKEEKGLVPPEINGIKYMTAYFFSKNNAAPLRGYDISNAIIEIFTITIWDKLDFLIIDMPPGLGDTTLDTIRLLKKMEFLLITTPSKISHEVLKKEVSILNELKINIVGIVQNMQKDDLPLINISNIDFLGIIDFDNKYESSLGNIDKLKKTGFYEDIMRVSKKILNK